MKYKQKMGCVWFTVGAQGGEYQPPYAIFYKNRWYHTNPSNLLTDQERTIINTLPRLDYGVIRCMDYLSRNNKHFNDLPPFDFKRFIT